MTPGSSDPLRIAVLVGGRLDEHGQPYAPEVCNQAATTMVDQLAWRAAPLRVVWRAHLAAVA